MKAQGTHALRRPTGIKDTEKNHFGSKFELDELHEGLQIYERSRGFL